MYDRMASFTLVAVPLFILMGEIIFVSGLGGDIYRAIRISLHRVRGSLAVASVVRLRCVWSNVWRVLGRRSNHWQVCDT